MPAAVLPFWSWQDGASWWTQPRVLLIASVVVAILAVWLLIRARRPLPLPSPAWEKAEKPKGEWIAELRRGADMLVAALRYLSTRREWRYTSPWVLLLGEEDGGKSSLAASLSDGRRESLLLREQSLQADGADWYFCSGGIVIDPQGGPAETDIKNEKRWHELLRAIDARRPERAIDSTVLVVSADTLLAPDPDALRQMAERCYRQLWQAQKAFEFVLPLHVVITRCDAVPGFGPFWRSQPETVRESLWGWANPSLNDHESPRDIARAIFDEVGGTIRQMQIDAAARMDKIDDADEFFLFPQRFAQLRTGVEGLLEAVLKPSVHHAGFYFRGVYFCGSVTADGEREPGVCGSVDFVNPLFHDKVFKEGGLARPLRQSVWSRNRLLRRMQIGFLAFFIALLLGLGLSGISLSRQIRDMEKAEGLVVLEAGKRRDMDGGCIAYSSVYRLLDQIGQLRTEMVYPFIPVSWVDHTVVERVGQWLSARSFNEVVMPSLECKLKEEAKRLYDTKTILESKPSGEASGLSISDTVDKIRNRLKSYVEDVFVFDKTLADFHQLTKSASPEKADEPVPVFEELARSVYKEPLPQSLLRGNGAYARMIASLNYGAAPDLLQNNYHTVIGSNMVAAGRVLQGKALDGIGLGGKLLADMERDDIAAADVIVGLRDWMSWLRVHWLGSGDRDDLCVEIGNDLSASLHAESSYRASVEELRALFDEKNCRAPARARLKALSVPPYGPLIQEIGGIRILNPALIPEMAGLEAAEKLPFMSVKPRSSFACRPSVTGWLDPELGEIDGFLRDYHLFALAAKLDLAAGPPLFDRLVRRQLQSVIGGLLSDAQRTGLSPELAEDPEARVADQSAGFGRQSEQLAKIATGLVKIGDSATAARLTDCLRNYASDALNRIDDLALDSRLYQPKPSGDADGAASVKIYAFSDAAAIRDYLQRQRDRISVLANYAEPYVRFLDATAALGQTGDREQAVSGRTRWHATLAELKRYQAAKDGGSTLGVLEGYFTQTLAQIAYDNCARLLEKGAAVADAPDLFSTSHGELIEQNSVRCYRRREADAVERYIQLSKRFNLELSGYYPFASSSARDLDLSVARSFFRDYAGERGALRHAVEGLKRDRWPEIARFLDQLDAAAALIEPSLASVDAIRPLRLDVTFRTLPKWEKGDDQLIGWALSSGDQQIDYPGDTHQLDWNWGEPLQLDLTWASQSAWRPAPAPQQGARYRVDGAMASFPTEGQWGLLRWIEAHRPRSAPDASPQESSSNALEFVVPVTDSAFDKSEARLYLTARLSAVDGKGQAGDMLILPRAWPRAAPAYW